MSSSRRLIISAAIAAVTVGAGVFVALRATGDSPGRPPSARVVQPGAPGQPGKTLSANEVSQLPPSRHTAADTLFFRRMIPHHAQALEMTALLPGRTTNPELTLLARRLDISQRQEIGRMQQWLQERGEQVPEPHTGHPGHDTLMPGMLSDEQLGQLRQASGSEFDRLFLQYMIRHHQGALAMVAELYATGGGLEPASDQVAREVNADQNIEIQRMQELLAKTQ
ncbi:DUF305 domain-containing protein [Planosporangium flavigriseum]|uniref:Lipoprotein n=1 Tax=Planosporangium flavigriseum TaxID=373681 RepID=A0A8J3LPK2_9ACTN|nr:DUF305 domain-containing protein [Planosporangium flavigriseum]NJC67517.1 DUF305 domain-containing protein [Planosporangium flavigriseum]GIG75532.1 lipoprotein [Planosporangium flavigriseum]